MPPTAKPPEGRRLYQQIADQICTFMHEQQLQPGTRLPPERELALQFGVSRPSLREALIALEISGRVEIRMGSGVYVCAPPPESDGSGTLALGESPSEVMQARALLEGAVIALAVARATPAGLARVRDCLEGMRQDGLRGRASIENDRRFHVAIADMTGNSLLVRLVAELFDSRHSPISSRMSADAEDADAWQLAFAEHEAIMRALEDRDPQTCQAMMSLHLGASHERWNR